MTATVLTDLPVTPVCYPNSDTIVYLEARCNDHDAYDALPDAVSYKGTAYTKTGWNSDHNTAYFKPGRPMAQRLDGSSTYATVDDGYRRNRLNHV